MKTCTVCQKSFDPEAAPADPSQEAGLFFARQIYGDVGDLCPTCLSNRGQLAMMYCREFD